MRIVACGQPEGGFAAMMGSSLQYFTSGDVVMPEGVKKEVFLTTPDERTQFILLFMDAAAEPAIKAQYGATVDDPAWKVMEAGAKEYGMMEVQTRDRTQGLRRRLSYRLMTSLSFRSLRVCTSLSHRPPLS